MIFDSVPAANDSTTIAKNDLLGLEVLDPTTPIPGFWKTNGGPDVGVTASFMWLPALSSRGLAAPSAELVFHEGSYSGFVPYFNFVFAPN